MAATQITLSKMTRQEALVLPTTYSVDATNGAYINFEGNDEKILIILQNSHASESKTATLKAGNGLQACSDLELTLSANSTSLLCIESGPYKIMSGSNKNKIKISATADVKLAALLLA